MESPTYRIKSVNTVYPVCRWVSVTNLAISLYGQICSQKRFWPYFI